MSDSTPADRLRTTMLAALEQYEKEAAPVSAEADYDDPLSRSYLRYLAKHVERSRTNGQDLSPVLAQVADEFTLLDLRILRTAAEAAAQATPALVMKHFAAGMAPPAIAKESGLTTSRIYGIIRQARADGWADPIPEGDTAYQAAKDMLTDVVDPIAAEAFLSGVRDGALPGGSEK